MAQKKKFKGIDFTLRARTKTKDKAQDEKKSWKKKGYKVRVVKGTKCDKKKDDVLYRVYARKG